MCFNCAGQLLALDPMPTTIAELRIAVSRERRRNDRRIGKGDSRVFRYERRVGDRRDLRVIDGGADQIAPIEDDMIIEVTLEPEPMSFEDLTSIRELVTHLRREDLAS